MQLPKKITKAKGIEMLTDLNPGDPEMAHADADDILLAIIGDPNVRAAYDAIQPKWYA